MIWGMFGGALANAAVSCRCRAEYWDPLDRLRVFILSFHCCQRDHWESHTFVKMSQEIWDLDISVELGKIFGMGYF